MDLHTVERVRRPARAEEIGFHGALAVAAKRGVPKNSLIVSLETSRELPGVKMGQGVILRVGDRTSIFDSEATLGSWREMPLFLSRH